MLLTLDRGNTTLDVMLHGAGGWRRRLPPTSSLSASLGGARPTRCVGVTVVPGGLDAIVDELARLAVPVQLVGREFSCPLPLDYDTPATLGADRWLGALAAHHRFGRAIVIDCGSATTVNLVEADGTFRGGAIAPGLRALGLGMQAATPGLPIADAAQATALPARSSAASVHTGVAAMFCGGIERLVAELLRSARGPATIVITGGHAADYLRWGRLQPAHCEALVHDGLALLAGSSA